MGSTDLRVVPFPAPKPVEAPWSPLEMLEQLVADIKAGKEKPARMFIGWLEPVEGGNFTPRWWNAGCEIPERIALLEIQKHALLAHWMA